MANKLKRITAVLITAVTMLCMVPVTNAARYDTMTNDVSYIKKLTYSGVASLTQTNGNYTTGGKTYAARSFALQASPKHVSIGVANGSYVYGKDTLSDMVAKYDKDGLSVIGALNGDFFDTALGFPLGLQVDGGRIYATNSAYESDGDIAKGRTTIGFKEDGSVVFGVPEIELSVTINDYRFSLTRVNSHPNYVKEWGWQPVILLTSDYAQKTFWTAGKAYDVIVLRADGDLSIGDDTTCHFDSFLQGVTDPITIEKDKFYIVAPTDYFVGFVPPEPDELPTPEDIANGAVPEINDLSYVSVTEKTGKWNDVVSAVCGGNTLVRDGQIVSPSTYDSSVKYPVTSRTAFGVKADGTYVFYVTDISGMRLDGVAQAMLDMGCVYAVNLDGGGSTTLLANEGDGLKLKNKPRDGSQRRISNGILILSRETAPSVIEDFEADMTFTDNYSGTNVVTATTSTAMPYTGRKALSLEYVLSGVGSSVFADFEPKNIKDLDMLSVAVNTGGAPLTVSARLKNADGIFTRPLEGTGDGYVRSQINVSDADELVGFEVSFKTAAKNLGTVYIDRVAGWRGYALDDKTAPTLTVTKTDTALNVSATKPLMFVPVDSTAAEIRVNGGETLFATSAALSDYPNDRVNRAEIYGVDVLGNRSVKYSVFTSGGYTSPLPFADMQDGKWDSLFIRYCFENGIINGFSENGQLLYKGSQNVTRAQFCLMIVSQKKLDINKYAGVSLPYEDAAEIPAWALPYVRAAYAEGIMTGSKTQTGVKFYPNNDITRAEAASALDRLMVKDTRLSVAAGYKDDADIGAWAKTSVREVTTQGLFEGDKDGNFYPNRNLTRSEAAVLMSKL